MNNDNDMDTEFDSTSEEGYSDDLVIDEELPQAQKIKQLREKLKQCESDRNNYLDGWQRCKAESINERKQSGEQLQLVSARATEALVLGLLPSIDSFEMAFSNEEQWASVDEVWRTGVMHIYNQLIATLKEYGVEAIEPLGEQFDPALHDSISALDTENEGEDGQIINVRQKGYRINDKIIRAAKVEVARYVAK